MMLSHFESKLLITKRVDRKEQIFTKFGIRIESLFFVVLLDLFSSDTQRMAPKGSVRAVYDEEERK